MGQAKQRQVEIMALKSFGVNATFDVKRFVQYLKDYVGDQTLPDFNIILCSKAEFEEYLRTKTKMSRSNANDFIKCLDVGKNMEPGGCVINEDPSVLRWNEIEGIWLNNYVSYSGQITPPQWYSLSHELVHAWFNQQHVLRCPLMNGVTNNSVTPEDEIDPWNVVAYQYMQTTMQGYKPQFTQIVQLVKKYYDIWKGKQ